MWAIWMCMLCDGQRAAKTSTSSRPSPAFLGLALHVLTSAAFNWLSSLNSVFSESFQTNLHFHVFSYEFTVTCSARGIFWKSWEGVHGSKTGAHRLPASLVNGKVNIAWSTGLQQSGDTEVKIMTREGGAVTLQHYDSVLDFFLFYGAFYIILHNVEIVEQSQGCNLLSLSLN